MKMRHLIIPAMFALYRSRPVQDFLEELRVEAEAEKRLLNPPHAS